MYLRKALGLLLFALIPVTSAWAEDPEELVFVFQKQKDPAKIQAEAGQVAERLSKELGMPVRVQVPSDYAASVQALVSRKADIAYVDSMAFLLARRDGGAKLLLVEERPDAQGVKRQDYDSIFVAKKDGALKSISDIVTRARDLRVAFTSPTSTSGYLMAYRRLVKEGLIKEKQDAAEVFKSISFAGSYVQALEQVLAGRADVAAVSFYALEGPAASKYLPKEKREKLKVIARSPGVPTHVIAARSGLSDVMIGKIKAAITKLSESDSELLSDVYGAASFAEADEDKHVVAAVEAVGYTGLPVDGIVSKSIKAKQVSKAAS